MQLAYRATRKHQPNKSDTLVSSREQAFKLIESLDKKLAGKIVAQERATFLCGRAVLYEALGDKKMLEAAQAAYAFSKTAQSAALVAVALHHYGRIKEALSWYERSYRYPHEAGFEIDIGMQQALLFSDDSAKWSKAWEITKKLKKRICYAAYLPTWDGKPVDNLQVISEGGFGDILQSSRYLPLLAAKGVKKFSVYLPPFFFEHGFVDLMKKQDWWPETKVLTEVRAGVPSAGFFDLPAIFQTSPNAIPPTPTWNAEINLGILRKKPRVGYCWSARAMETPICADNTYRSLSNDKAQRVVSETSGVEWVSLQHGVANNLGVEQPELKSWVDTEKVISTLDAVVSVDTAVFHLAANMGKPTHVLLSGAVDHKFGVDGTKCRWYPSVTVWRSNEFGFDNSLDNFIGAINKRTLFQVRTGEAVL